MQKDKSERTLQLIRQQIGRLKNKELLIISHREDAFRIARGIIKRVGMSIKSEDLRSAVDLALVEAANNYVKDNRAKFTTFLFYHLKGRLLRTLCEERYWSHHHRSDASISGGIENSSLRSKSEELKNLPDEIVEKNDIKQSSYQFISNLSDVERQVIVGVYFDERTLEDLAGELGYSRAHISRIRDKALTRLRLRRLKCCKINSIRSSIGIS